MTKRSRSNSKAKLKSKREAGRSTKMRVRKAKALKAKAHSVKAHSVKARKPKASKARPSGRPVADQLAELRQRLREISDLYSAGALLDWDQATYMPTGGATARGRQLAMLRKLAHERFVDPALGRLLDALAPHAERLPHDSDDASLVRVARREFERAIKVPADYVARSNAHGSASYDAWTRARPANDFATMRPFLEQSLELSREYADFFAPYDHIADPLIDEADEGMTTATIRKLFAELRRELVPIVQAICDQPPTDDSCLHASFAEAQQLDFGLSIARRMGYDLDRGRLDKTHHPFCTKFALGDVRITTRVREDDLGDALFSTLHEGGHAMYEQGVAPALEGTPLGRGASSGVHESQSRLWENVVGRSLAFWEHYYPALQQVFPDALGRVPLETFYRAVNKVACSLIRTDADEVTYNLHVMLRFEIELQLLEGRLRIKDLPDAWNAAMRLDLGVEPDGDRDGCLQDVHWFSGGIGGAFQSYTIGNILAAQFHAAAVKAHPGIPGEVAQGSFGTLHGWLEQNIYRHGRKYLPRELVERATGEPMTMAPYLGYLRTKYGALYRLPAT